MKKLQNAYAPLFPYLATAQNAILAPGELIIDNFAGLGGASTGLEQALGRPVDVAINHSRQAIELHSVNHPYTRHYVEDVWEVNPLEVTGGQPVALAWFSPTCTHFSKAKGSGLLDRKIRGLAWVTLRWADLVKPRVIILENVEEFQGWGPLTKDGRPDPKQKGRTFRSFVNALRYQGYQVEHRELRASEYGAPTIRKRLFLIARRDGLPIVWPEATHAAPTSSRVLSGELKTFRTAAECIDWELPTPSIFTRKKPLVPATMKRISRGIQRFVLDAAEPFIVTCNHSGETFRGQGLDKPFNTVTAANEAHGLTQPILSPFLPDRLYPDRNHPADQPLSTITTTHNKNELASAVLAPCIINKQHQAPARAATDPLSTVTTNHNKNELLTGYLVPRYGEADGQAARVVSVESPSPTIVTTGNGSRLAVPVLIKTDNQRSRNECVYPVERPLGTVVSKAGHALILAHLTKFNTGSVGSSLNIPAPTVVAGGESTGPHGLVAAQLVTYYGPKREGEVRGLLPSDPLKTQGTENRFALLTASLVKHYGGTYQGAGVSLASPVATITSVDHHALLTGHLIGIDNQSSKGGFWNVRHPLNTIVTESRHGLVSGALVACGGRGAQARPKAINEVMHTITSKADMCLTSAHLQAYYSSNGKGDLGQEASDPLRTVPTTDRFGVTAATLMRQFGTSTAADVAAPLGTIVSGGNGKTHLVMADCQPDLSTEQLARARQVYALLAQYAPEALNRHADHAQQLVVLPVRGEWYVLADIGMRMLSPRELAACQGFPETYKLDATLDGKPLSKAAQVRGIGNSVCPDLARVIAFSQLTAQADAAD
jgi:DNA (cytosine-5)-methyltransferase 1